MAYVTMSDGQYHSTLGPYGTPGWQFARPGWGKNMDFSAANPWVGVGGPWAADTVANSPAINAAGYTGVAIGAVVGGLLAYLLLRR
jgi:uncharacterized protein (TIGR03382 family)